MKRFRKKKEKNRYYKNIVIDEYEKEVTFICPVRGEVTQKVIVKRYKTVPIKLRHVVGSEDNLSELGLPEGYEKIIETNDESDDSSEDSTATE